MKQFPIHRGFWIYPELKRIYKLSSDQYMVIESIRKLSTTNPEFRWCSAPKDDIADFCVISRSSVFRTIEKGVQMGLIERHPEHDWVRTTRQWNEQVEGLTDLRGTSLASPDSVGQSQIDTGSVKSESGGIPQKQSQVIPKTPMAVSQSQIDTESVKSGSPGSVVQSQFATEQCQIGIPNKINNKTKEVVIVPRDPLFDEVCQTHGITYAFLADIMTRHQVASVEELHAAVEYLHTNPDTNASAAFKGLLYSGDVFFHGQSKYRGVETRSGTKNATSHPDAIPYSGTATEHASPLALLDDPGAKRSLLADIQASAQAQGVHLTPKQAELKLRGLLGGIGG